MKQICEIPETVNVISSLGTPEGLVFIVARNKEDVNAVLGKLRSMNLDTDFPSSVIRTYDEGRLGTYFRAMAGTDERKSAVGETQLGSSRTPRTLPHRPIAPPCNTDARSRYPQRRIAPSPA